MPQLSLQAGGQGFEAKNGGFITRDDVNLIVARVGEFADAQERNLKSGPNSVHFASAASEIDARIDRTHGPFVKALPQN